MSRLSWIDQEDPKCNYNCPYKGETEGYLTHRRVDNVTGQVETGVMWPINLEMLATVRSWKQQRTDPPQNLQRERRSWHLDFGLLKLILDFWPLEL